MSVLRNLFPRSRSFLKIIFLLSGLGILLVSFLIGRLSEKFGYSVPLQEKPILLFIALYLLAGVSVLFATSLIGKIHPGTLLLASVILLGAFYRLLLLPSTAILEDDFYRYLWDGAVTAHFVDPYCYSPQQVRDGEIADPDDRLQLTELSMQAGDVFQRINFPAIRTIYPPVAQVAFAIAYSVKPWSLLSWRILLLLIDGLNLFLILRLLGRLGRSPLWSVIYWWNPIVLKEFFNAGHMDLLIFPFFLGSFLLVLKKKYLAAAIVLALATGVKFWPVVLLPLFLRPLWTNRRKLLISTGGFLSVAALMLVPLYLSGFDRGSAIMNYSQRWEGNDSLFKLVLWLSEKALQLLGLPVWHQQPLARVSVVVILLLWIFLLIRKLPDSGEQLLKKSLFILAALFLLSPTQFPWYFTWVLILLPFQFHFSLFMLTLFLPLYYLRYYLEGTGQLWYFDHLVVWVEFVPIWLLIFWEWRKSGLRGVELPETGKTG